MPGFGIRLWLVFWLGLWLSLSTAQANHSANEPSDGTVGSFIELEPPQAVADVALRNAEGEAVKLSDWQGKLVLLNLWATWCPPCIRELPALDRVQKRLGGEHFEVVAVALDEGGIPAARQFYQRLDIGHLGLFVGDIEAFGQVFPVDVFPASFFIGPRGRVLSYLRSYADWDDPDADAKVRTYLQEHGLR